MRRPHPPISLLVALALPATTAAQPALELHHGDRVVFVGNTFAERLQMFSSFETMLAIQHRELELRFRNLGWSADTLTLKPRPMDFGSEDEHLRAQKADVIFACYGMNEAFEGEAGLEQYVADWNAFLSDAKDAGYNRDRAQDVVIAEERVFPGIDDGRTGERAVRIVMVSPIAHEDLPGRLPDPTAHNENLALYTDAMREVAARHRVPFIDLFTPTRAWMAEHPDQPLTFNGIHLTAFGDWVVARMMMEALGFERTEAASVRSLEAAALREKINDKNRLWFYRWRAVNGFYIYGGRKQPFGVQNFPGEMAKLEELIRDHEVEIDRLSKEVVGGYAAVAAPEAGE